MKKGNLLKSRSQANCQVFSLKIDISIAVNMGPSSPGHDKLQTYVSPREGVGDQNGSPICSHEVHQGLVQSKSNWVDIFHHFSCS